MEHFHVLKDLLVVFCVAGAVIFLFHRVRIPAVVGLLVSGLVAGPTGLALVGDDAQVELLAEIGVVILLFTVGLEFSLSRLIEMWRTMLAVGLPQVFICVGLVSLVMWFNLRAIGPAIFVGMLIAMSSTAIVLKVLTDRGELGTPSGRMVIAVLLVQDLLVIPFTLLMPLLSGQGANGSSPWWPLARGLGVVILVLVGSRYVLTPLLHQVVLTRNRELFLISIFLMCIGTAMLTAWAGLSLALGAFLAGLALSESEYAHQMFSEVAPFRDTLSSLFFVSVGMLLDLRYVFAHSGLVLLLVVAVVVVKFLAAALPTVATGYPLRVAAVTGMGLAQVGEFSFVMAQRGSELALIRPEHYQAFLATAVVTMMLTPLLIAGSPRLARRITALPSLSRFDSRRQLPDAPVGPEIQDHVIIVGFGVGGRNLARVLRSVEIPYTILEMNPEAVRRSKAQGEPIHFGDSTRAEILEHLGLARARVLVVMISDPAALRRTVQLARRLNPALHIMVRTRFVTEIDDLRSLGANEVVPEDFVSSVEIFSRVLRDYRIPRNQILDLIEHIRSDHYEALRGLRPARLNQLHQEIAKRSEVDSCSIAAGSPAAGRTLSELHLRAETGATLLGVRRNGEMVTNPDAAFRFEPGDVAILFGDRDQVARASRLLSPGSTDQSLV